MKETFASFGRMRGIFEDSARLFGEQLLSVQRRNVEFASRLSDANLGRIRDEARHGYRSGVRLAERMEAQKETSGELLKEFAGAYIDFIYSPLAVGGEVVEEVPASPAVPQVAGPVAPIVGYDDLNVKQVAERLDGMSSEGLEKVREYEVATKNRETVLREVSSRLEESGS